jgi:hypothetical protein
MPPTSSRKLYVVQTGPSTFVRLGPVTREGWRAVPNRSATFHDATFFYRRDEALVMIRKTIPSTEVVREAVVMLGKGT